MSIIVPCHGKWHLTERCLDTVVDALGPKLGSEFELVIVDDGSPDETPQRLEEWRDRAQVVSLMPNRGFAGGCNAGARAARGEVLLFLNNDTLARPGVFEALAEEALDPEVGAVGLRLLYADMTIQHGGVAWYRDAGGRLHSFHLFRFEAGDLPAASAPLDLDFVTGACLAIRRELYFELGGFDERYANGFEDVDLCCKVRLSGHRVVYRGDLWMIHDEGLTRGRNNDEAENAALFHQRWGSLLEDDGPTIRSLYDAEFNPDALLFAAPSVNPWGSAVSVEGQVGGLAPESAEARSLLATLELAGLAPAAREWQQVWVSPRLDEDERSRLQRALRRPTRAGALVVSVPVGTCAPVPAGAADVLRVASVPPGGVGTAAALWAASPKVAQALVAEGVAAGRVDVLPPPVPDVPLGEGGAGLLAILPAEDLGAACALLDELARLPSTVPVRLLPTVASPVLHALVRERLPRGELLAPVSSERRYAALAGESDVVLCGSRSDRFERAALLAAAAGATPVTPEPGPAAGVLDDLLVVGSATAATLERALAGRALRRERAERVSARCSPSVVAPRVRELVEKALELRAGGPRAAAA